MFKNKKRLFASIVATSLFLNNTGIITFAEGNEQTVVEEAEVETAEVEVSEAEEKETEVVVEEPKEEVVEEKAEEVEEITESAEESSEEMIPESQEEETEETVEEIADEDEIAEEEPRVDEETEVQEEVEEEVRVKKVYEYSDAKISVKATLQYAEAIPDDAEFVVTELTGEIRDTYLAALNASEQLDANYSKNNTLLYDMAFMVEEKDSRGEVIEGKKVEYEPEKGSVKLDVEFKNDQLSEVLNAETGADVAVIHMPVDTKLVQAAGSTLEAKASVKDIDVEVLADTTKISGVETTSFTLDSFSVVAVGPNGGSIVPGTALNVLDILGEAKYFGVTTYSFNSDNHMDSNLATYEYYGTNNFTPGTMNNANRGGEVVIGKVINNGYIKLTDGTPHKITLGNTITSSQYEITGDRANVIVFESDSAVKNRINGMLDHTFNSMADLVKENANKINTITSASGGEDTLDIKAYGAGTYYFKDTNGVLNGTKLKIEKDTNQKIVIIFDKSGTLNTPQMFVNGQAAEQIQNNEELVLYYPNATKVTVSDIGATVIAPKADVDFANSSGWLVCKEVTHHSAEWHFRYQDMPDPTGLKLNVTKTYKGDWTGKEFKFTLTKVKGNDTPSKIKAPQTISATAADKNPTFEAFSFGPYTDNNDHVYVFKVEETDKTDATINYDSTVYYAKVVAKTSNNATTTSVNYYADENCTIPAVNNGLVFTNTDKPQTTDLTVIKVWDDAKNQDGKRPEKLEVKLKAGNDVAATVTLNDDNQWTATVKDLPVYANGAKITYTWDEGTLPEGYTLKTGVDATGKITTLTNSYKPEKTDLTVIKVWDDEKNQDGKRPEKLDVKLMAGNDVAATVTLNDDNQWTATVKDLPVYANGTKITYKWDEGTLPEGYALSTDVDTTGKITTLTNSHTPEKTDLTVIKVWDDAKNQDGKRPEKLEVKLMAGNDVAATVTLNDDNQWTATVKDLPVYANGTKITYKWDEGTLPEGYALSTDVDTTGKITTLTNSHTPEKTDLTVIKVWDDEKNQDGKRPEKLDVKLMAGNDVAATVTLNDNNQWTATVKDLPVYANGTKITYKWDEGTLPEGYALSTDVDTTGKITTLTNSYTPKTTEAEVIKVWDDEKNQDGKRPAELKVKLLADGAEVKTVTLNDGNNWTTKVENLPAYANGKLIDYTWEEDKNGLPEGYKWNGTSKSGTVTTITNAYKPKTTEAEVIKVWDDEKNQDGKRPAELKVKLLADGAEVKTVTLNDGNNWTTKIENLPAYENGAEIEYTWTEDTTGLPTGYSQKSNSTVGTVTTITNSYTPETTSVSGEKEWDDNDNQDGKRPDSITIQLVKKVGEKTSDVTGKTAVISGTATGDALKYSWTNLPKYENGTEIVYSVKEVGETNNKIAGKDGAEYTVTYGTNNKVTNSHKPEETERSVKKVWDDADDQDGKRPTELKVVLTGSNGYSKTVTLNDRNGWTATVDKLPVYAAGKKIEYTWSEPEINYYDLTDTSIADKLTTLTNTHTPAETDLTVIKNWNDNENQDGYRPGSLDVDLLANDEVYTTVTLNATNDWTATVDKLPVYANGKLITYKWSEKNLPKSYTLTSSVSSGAITTLTNTHKADTTEATITKVWDDNKNQDGKRPASLDVDLLADGVKVDTVTLNAGNDWTVTVSNLPAKKAGEAIAYTWSEPNVEGYNLTGNKTEGIITTLTNTHTPEKTEKTVVKDWDDEKNQDGKRPLEIKVDLLADGKVIDTVTLNGANKWTATVENLDVYAAGEVGQTITYTWSEGKIEGYSLTNTATTTDGKVTTLTNTHTPETTERSVKKVWEDADNQDGKRPAELKVDLLADGKVINTVTLNKDNGWTATVDKLPVYAAGEVGQTITYKWSEAEIKGYNLTNTATTADGKVTTLTNTHTPETTEISGGKTWDDSDNQDGIRPKSITVKLLADDEVVATKDVTAREKWNWKFEGMPKYKNGKEIEYKLAEIDVPGYKAKVEGYNIVNTHKAATTEKAVRKIWDDNNNQDGKRPAELKVVLKANGVIEREVTLNESNFWSAVIENLPVNRAGVKIDYTWEEDKTGLPEGYNLTDSKTDDEEFITTLTNSYKPEEVDILGTKTWNDDDNKAGFRPDYIMINLFADDVKIDSKKVTANDKWSWSWTNLPKYAAGKVIKYTITEDKVEHYATEIYGYDVINTPTSVKVSKVDITDQKEIEGAHIKVVDKFGKVVDEWDSKKEVHIITDLTIGDTYTLIETVAPEGYTIAAETTFYINAGGRVMSSGTVTTDGVVLVEDTMTSVKISKVDVTDQKELEGAHIQIIDSKGTVVEEWDSKKEVHVVEGLKTNETYTLKETVAPIGYTITTDTTFVIDEKGNVTTTGTITEGGVILVEDAMTEVEVSKVDIVGGEELEGAHIQIIDKEGVVVKEWDSTKTPEMIRGLHTNETYTLKETVAPEGYTIATETTFIIDEKGNVTTTGTKSDEGVLLIEDAKTNVKVSKVDITDQHELEGAHIQVIDSKGVVVEEWDSTKVVHVIEGLKTNETYTLKETVAPLGYTIATENTFIIDEKGNVTTTATMTEGGVILVEDTLTEVKVSKVDIADGKELPGAKIQIINKAGEVVEEWISTTRIHVVKGLHTNEEYTLHEEVAPEGYIVATDTTFIIDENGKVTTTGTITEGGVLLIEDSMTHVEVNKIDDSPSHRLIGGAHLVLRDSKGNIVASWITEAGKAFDLIGLLSVGETYTLVEVSAPAGYDIAAPITFTIDKTGHIQIGGNTVGKITMVDVEILNDEDDVPPSDDIHEDVNTGDNSNLMLWITMFVTSAMGGLYVIYRKREDEVNC